MNQNQKNYLIAKIYEIQCMLEEKESEKKEINAGFNGIIKSYKKKITRFIHSVKEEDEIYLNDMMSDEEFKKFEKF